MDIDRVRFSPCFFCEYGIRVGEDYIEIRHEMLREEDRKNIDPLLEARAPAKKGGFIFGRPRVIMTTSYFMHRKCWYEYKLQGRRPNRYKGQPMGAKNGKSTLRIS